MKFLQAKRHKPAWVFLLFINLFNINWCQAGDSKMLDTYEEKNIPAERKLRDDNWLLPSVVTVGGKVGEHLTDGMIDWLVPFYSDKQNLFFFNSTLRGNDSSDEVINLGLGYRYKVPDRQVILGINTYYDYLDTRFNNHYDQFGAGVEMLTKWVDARFNYYLPSYQINRVSRRFHDGDILETLEAPFEGFDTEIGFLVPYLDKYTELRLFAGYYNFDNRIGTRYEGPKARVEWRVLQGVILDFEYHEDEGINGGKYAAGMRISAPFSLENLFTGKNPFEGIGEFFKFGPRDFEARRTEQVMRWNWFEQENQNRIRKSRDSRSDFGPGGSSRDGGDGPGSIDLDDPTLDPENPPGPGFPIPG